MTAPTQVEKGPAILQMMAEVKATAVALKKSRVLWTYLGVRVHKISGKGSSPGKSSAFACIAAPGCWLVHEMTDSEEAHLRWGGDEYRAAAFSGLIWRRLLDMHVKM